MSQKSLVKSFLGFLIGPVIGAGIGFFTTIITTWLLNPEEIGKSATTTVYITLMSLFIYFGLDQAFIREYNEVEDKTELFWNSIYLPLILSIFISLLTIIFGQSISYLLFKEENIFAVIIIAISIPFYILDRYSMLILRMDENAKIYSLIQVLNKILNIVILIIYLVFIQKSYIAIIFSLCTSTILTALVGVYITKEYWINMKKINIGLTKRLLRYGLPLIPAMIIASLFNSMDKIALVTWSNFEEVGLYTIGFKIIVVISLIQGAFSTFWAPVSQRWYSEGKDNTNIVEISYLMCSCVSIMYILLILFKDIIINILLPESYQNTAILIPVLSYVPLMSLLALTTCVGINFSRKTEFNIIPSIIALVTNYILNKALIPSYGALGAGISTAISYTIYFIVITLLSRKLWFRFSMKFILINVFMLIIVTLNVIFIDNIWITIILSFFIIIYNFNNYVKIYNIFYESILKSLIKKVRGQ
ncbi:oligosaccharide flippase family protein [Clostridium paraputrificum]|uniref:oligosaccharide flippase family protein n=1 Tax=Clostridium paraputrificum TaxID=29363 RepID=UPI000C06925C|nr:oligosaccharide flippase family protein [Clostridium paraputrificum]